MQHSVVWLRELKHNILIFITRPLTIIRMLIWVFSVIILGCITADGYVKPHDSSQLKCIFNENARACQSAVSIGTLSFMGCILFLGLDASRSYFRNPKKWKSIIILDLLFSSFMTLLWIIGFLFLVNQWSPSSNVVTGADSARAIMAFSFISILFWVLLVYFAVKRLMVLQQDIFNQTYQDPNHSAITDETRACNSEAQLQSGWRNVQPQ